jgi:hypothetical protein
MFLIRTAFWISLVILLLPSDERRQAELYGKAVAAANWTLTFCDRNPETCVRSGELWQTFKVKAEFAGQVAGDLIQRGLRGDTTPAGTVPTEARTEPAASRGPVPADDLSLRWRGQPKPPRA